MFECPGGRLGFALAGITGSAISAIQKCAKALENTEPENTITKVEEILEREYRRAIFEHPDYGSDPNLDYHLLISFWSRMTNSVSLFKTQQHILHACYGSGCIGIGFELANVLIRPFFADTLGEHDTLILAAYTLAQ